jgi:hypothetical protein
LVDLSQLYGTSWSLGGIIFNGGPDSNGVDWIVTEEAGWFSAPQIKTARVDKPSARGSLIGNEYRGSRVITLSGEMAAPNVSTLRAAQRQVLGICPSPQSLYPIVGAEEDGTSLSAMVKLDGSIITRPKSLTTATFSVQLVAPDPRRLSTSVRSSTATLSNPGSGGVTYPVTYPVNYGVPGIPAAVSMSNNGTADSDFTITFQGPLTAPILYNVATGDYIGYTQNLVAGDVVAIDTSSGSVMFNGSPFRVNLVLTQWPVIPAGGTLNLSFRSGNPADTGSVAVNFTDSYF